MEEESAVKRLWEKQKMVTMYGAVELAGDALLPYIVPDITRVVDTITGRTAVVYKILPKFGVQVWVKERGQERENWSWSHVTVRQPRRLKRYPRPFRWPREEPTKQCHCKIGKMEVESVEERAVRCTRCKFLIGSESYPRRIERAENDLRKASTRKPRLPIHKGVQRRNKRQTVRRSKSPVKARGKGPSSLVVPSKRRSDAKSSIGKARKRAVVSKVVRRPRPLPKNSKVPPVHKKVGKEVGTPKGKVKHGVLLQTPEKRPSKTRKKVRAPKIRISERVSDTGLPLRELPTQGEKRQGEEEINVPNIDSAPEIQTPDKVDSVPSVSEQKPEDVV